MAKTFFRGCIGYTSSKPIRQENTIPSIARSKIMGLKRELPADARKRLSAMLARSEELTWAVSEQPTASRSPKLAAAATLGATAPTAPAAAPARMDRSKRNPTLTM